MLSAKYFLTLRKCKEHAKQFLVLLVESVRSSLELQVVGNEFYGVLCRTMKAVASRQSKIRKRPQ